MFKKITLFLIAACGFSVLPTETLQAQLREICEAKIRNLGREWHGLRITCKLSGREWFEGQEAEISLVSSDVEMRTSCDGSWRDYQLIEQRQNSSGSLDSNLSQKSVYVDGQATCNYRIYSNPNRDPTHIVTCFVDTPQDRDILYAFAGYLFGVSEIDQENFRDLIDMDESSFVLVDKLGLYELSWEDSKSGSYHFRFDPDTLRLNDIEIEKSTGNTVSVAGNVVSLLEDQVLAKDDPKKSIRIQASNIEYSDELPVSMELSITETSRSGKVWHLAYVVTLTNIQPLESDTPGSLLMNGVPVNAHRQVIVFDDPNVRYVISEDGKLAKTIDPRALDSISRLGKRKTEVQPDRLAKHDRFMRDEYLRTSETRAHCGVYALMAAFEKLGIDYRPENLLDSQYIGSNMGSSAEELIKACNDHDIQATFVENLTLATLRHWQEPLLLLMETRAGEGTNHWILFDGDEGNGQARILDVPREDELVSYKTLLANWKGRAILLGESKMSLSILTSAFFEKCLFVLFSVFAIALSWCALKKFAISSPLKNGALVRFSSLLGIGLVTAVVFHQTSMRGLLNCDAALLTFLQARNHEFSFERMDLEDVIYGVKHGKILLVDARFPAAFSAGHIPTAINFPVDASMGELERCLVNLKQNLNQHKGEGKEFEIVVYCQSDMCEWDTSVAALIFQSTGIKPKLFEAGWVGWPKEKS